jgi:hypothetical protein
MWSGDRLAAGADKTGEHRDPVLADQERILGDEHPHTVRTRHTLAWALGRQGNGRAAEEMLRQVLDQCRRILGGNHPNTLSTRHALVTGRS